MKRFITFKDVNIKIGELYKNERIKNHIRTTEPYNVDIIVSDVYANLKNEYSITVDCTLSYGTIEKVLGIRKRDLYYLNTSKQTISKEQILSKLMEQEFIKFIVISNLRGE